MRKLVQSSTDEEQQSKFVGDWARCARPRSLLREPFFGRLADRFPDLCRNGQCARRFAFDGRLRGALTRDANVRAGGFHSGDDRGRFALKVIHEGRRLDGNQRVAPVLGELLRLALPQHGAAREHAGEHLDAQGQPGSLVAAKRGDRATLERLGGVCCEARAIRFVCDAFRQGLALGLRGEHAEERDRGGRHVEGEGLPAAHGDAERHRVGPEDGLPTRGGGDKLG
mmetsp:Transcript_39064/g.94887  ORF Transcript_39064/g.94887 Transcript_39064/m.94887 type:complete len:226 (-) Transcript_39064:497-1174(-)